MRKIKDILRLKWVQERRNRHIARALEVGVASVSRVVHRAAAAGLSWERVEALSEAELEAALYGAERKQLRAPLPDPQAMDLELKKPGVTLQLLHLEYREHHPDGYGYTQFCEHYRRWKKRQRVVMRHVHRAGEKMFTDYAGKKPHWIEPATGELHEVELFVAVLGASNYTYAEASESQQVPYWLGSNTRALEYFGGVPALVVPDQLKSAVTAACRYEPAIQRTFAEWAAHYGTVILPARPAHPRDKVQASHCDSFRACGGSFSYRRRSRKRLPGCGMGAGPVGGATRISPLSLARTASKTPSSAKRCVVHRARPSSRATSLSVRQPARRSRSYQLSMA
ncbi:MAG TPA: IS21 family transposase [Spirochaetia bacterium]|nr:IS21 family transposase [Spirochaetia bacterium]